MSAVVLLVALAATRHAPIDCAQRPAACSRALRWQRAEHAHLARENHALRQHLRRVHAPTVREAAELAGRALHVDAAAMLRVGLCETGGTLDPYALNSSSGAEGWLQFMPSTWAHTPFAAWPRTNPFAQALAAAQIVRADGGYAQWSCRP